MKLRDHVAHVFIALRGHECCGEDQICVHRLTQLHTDVLNQQKYSFKRRALLSRELKQAKEHARSVKEELDSLKSKSSALQTIMTNRSPKQEPDN